VSQRDTYHHAVKVALEQAGWTITDDPLDLSLGEVELFADLGAERVIGAQRDEEKIAVEIKSFVGQSPVSEFHKAVGQYGNYRLSLEELDPERSLWLAVPESSWQTFFQRPFVQKAIQRFGMEVLVYDPDAQIIISWHR
jgi:hypothetical protein